jgi:hypothetical protein
MTERESGPRAFEGLAAVMADLVCSGVKERGADDGLRCLTSLRTLRCCLEDVWVVCVVNCLLNALAMLKCEVCCLLLKEMGMLGGVKALCLPERVLMADHSLVG